MTRAVDPRGGAIERYAVIGHPVAHSLSPVIHRAFADETGEAIDYVARLAPLDGFGASVEAFMAEGGRGLNVTVPFKLEAFDRCTTASVRARAAGAVNCMTATPGGIAGDNTDGIGLVRDLERLGEMHGIPLAGSNVLLAGAGGSARGVIGPLLDAGVARLTLVARDRAKAQALVHSTQSASLVEVSSFDDLGAGHDLVINATSSGLTDASLPIARHILASASLAYDLMYGDRPTRFLIDAQEAGTRVTADGLGMLVEQAAESFAIWRGIRPSTAPVLAMLRATRAAR